MRLATCSRKGRFPQAAPERAAAASHYRCAVTRITKRSIVDRHTISSLGFCTALLSPSLSTYLLDGESSRSANATAGLRTPGVFGDKTSVSAFLWMAFLERGSRVILTGRQTGVERLPTLSSDAIGAPLAQARRELVEAFMRRRHTAVMAYIVARIDAVVAL